MAMGDLTGDALTSLVKRKAECSLQLLVLLALPAPQLAGDSPVERDAWNQLRCCKLGMVSTWQKTQEFYNWILEIGDPRTDPWPLVYSPLPVILVFTSYLFMVALGLSCMWHQWWLELRAPLLTYNLAMVALSSYMFYKFLVTSVLANYSYLCQPVDYSQSEVGMRVQFWRNLALGTALPWLGRFFCS